MQGFIKIGLVLLVVALCWVWYNVGYNGGWRQGYYSSITEDYQIVCLPERDI